MDTWLYGYTDIEFKFCIFGLEVDSEFKMGYLHPGLFWTRAYWDTGPRTQGPGDPGPGDPGARTRGPGLVVTLGIWYLSCFLEQPQCLSVTPIYMYR